MTTKKKNVTICQHPILNRVKKNKKFKSYLKLLLVFSFPLSSFAPYLSIYNHFSISLPPLIILESHSLILLNF